MQIRKFWFAIMIFVSLTAVADFRTVERAYEVALSDMTVPVTTTGQLVFKQCEDCDYQSIPMTGHTLFLVNGHSVELKEFRKRTQAVRDRESETIVVMHHLESNTITSLSVEI